MTGDVNYCTIQFLDFHVQLRYMNFEFLNRLDGHQFLFRDIIQLGK